jgi:hypothetical protein
VTAAPRPDPGRGIRLVLLAGVTLGTFVLASAMWAGARPRVGSLPGVLGQAAGTVLLWLAVVAVATVIAAVVRACWRPATRLAWHHGRAGGAVAARYARERGGAAALTAAGWAGQRWRARFPPAAAAITDVAEDQDQAVGGRPVTGRLRRRLSDWLRPGEPRCGLCGGTGESPDGTGTCAACRGMGSAPPDPGDPEAAPGTICETCGRPGTEQDPVLAHPGGPGHRSHATEMQDAYQDTLARHGQPPPREWAGRNQRVKPDDTSNETSETGGTTMTTTTAHSAPAGWKALAAGTADFEPADDAELLAWMGDQVAGMLGYGEALASVHETCVSGVRLDPAAMAALHDVADATADAAEAMARAIERFKQVYEAPRGFVADGGVLPKSGDFITGDGD